MIDELKRVFKDIQKGKNIENYVLAIAAIVIAVLGIYGSASQSVIDAAVLAVLAVLVYGRAADQRRGENQIKGIREFHPNRSTVPSLNSSLSEAKHEILLIGVALSSVVHTQQGLITKLASKGCKIKIAIWQPQGNDTDRIFLYKELEKLINVPDLERNLPGNTERFRHFYSALDKMICQNVEIRCFSTLPTLSLLFIDKDYPHGYVHVEPIIYKAPPEDLPSFRLGVNDSDELFQVLKNQYSQLWEASEPLFKQ